MSKKFNHHWVEIPKLKQITTEKGRRYEVNGEVAYPSITTVLGKTKDNRALFEWRKRVGAETANKISRNATTRGTSMHKLCERYLRNEQVDAPKPTPAEDLEFTEINDGDWTAGQLMFSGIRPLLDRVDNVRCLETGLFSHHLGVAGTVDCIAEYDNTLAVVDFKTSRRPKKKENIEDYFLQGAFYFTAYHEITGELPRQIAILVSVQDGTNQEFIVKGREIIQWTEKLKERIEDYNNVINSTVN